MSTSLKVLSDNPYSSACTSPDDAWEEGYQAGAHDYASSAPDVDVERAVDQARRLVTHLRTTRGLVLHGWPPAALAILEGDLDDALEVLRGG